MTNPTDRWAQCQRLAEKLKQESLKQTNPARTITPQRRFQPARHHSPKLAQQQSG